MRRLVFLVLLLCGGTAALAQTPAPPGDPYAALRFLLGDWVADGPAAAGSGHFEFTPDVQGNVLVRRNHSEAPAANGRPATNHDDLMVVYREGTPAATRAVYFDNERHVIRYAVSSGAPDTATFVSEAETAMPRFRLSYTKLPDGRLSGKFEIAPPGKADEFKTYLEWTAKRK
ncbi:MAG TPA: hypothetical protein VF173_12910 [Thermoanaerobaculia bacterium]|nr:hypothetical protein [Thermoanaerobaculia bacterium]